MPFEMENIPDPLADAFDPIDKPLVQAQPEVEKPPVDPATTERLNQIAQGVEQNTVLTQLLAIPEIQAVLKARQSGQPVQVLSGQQQPQTTPVVQEAEPDWEKIKEDPKALTDHIISRLSKDVSAKQNQQLSDVLKPLVDKIGAIETTLVEHGNKEVVSKIEAVKNKYADFEVMKPLMRELNSRTSGLDAEELYLMAKAKKGEAPVLRDSLASERTTNSSAKLPSQTQQRKYSTGRRGFEQALDDALKSQDLESMFNPSK